MSEAERYYKAKGLQGKLKPEQIASLREDVLRVLDGKRHPKTYMAVLHDLVRHCGWEGHKIKGPTPYVERALRALENDGLVDSSWETNGEGMEAEVIGRYWRKSEQPTS